MNKLKTWLGILCVFSLGIMVGALGVSMYKQYKIARFLKGGRESIVTRIMGRYNRELNLTEAQYIEIEKIVVQSRQEWEKLRRKYQPEKDEIIKRRLAGIKEHLADEQQQKIDKMDEEKRQKRRHHKNRHP